MQPTVKGVLNYLHPLKMKGLSNGIINSARSTLSVYISLEGLMYNYNIRIGVQHKVPFSKSLYEMHNNINPSLPKYSFTWDIGIVMKYLSAIPNNFKKRLSVKLATLFEILCGLRTREVFSAIDLRNIYF